MARAEAPNWARHLSDDDEWVVRTALANIARDLESVAEEADRAPSLESSGPVAELMRETAARYRATLARIEDA
jgi:hypothetical protein